MKKRFRNSLPVLIAALSFLFSFTSLPDKANFSGEWNLNKDKSDLGQFADYATRIIKADQKADMISISKTSNSFNGGEVTTTEALPFDGKETETTIFGNSKKKTSVKWSDDGQTLTMTYTMLLDFNGQTNEIKGVETWTLADGGKTLISQNNSTSSFGDLATKAVYEKKQLLLLSVVVIHFLLFVKLWSLNIISYIDLKMNLRKFLPVWPNRGNFGTSYPIN